MQKGKKLLAAALAVSALFGGVSVQAADVVNAEKFNFYDGDKFLADLTGNDILKAIEAAKNAGIIGLDENGQITIVTKVEGEGGLAIGSGAVSKGWGSVALGRWSQAASNSVALGSKASAEANGTVVIGALAKGGEQANHAVALGYNTYVGKVGGVALGANSYSNSANEVSVGNSTLKRKIVNVAAGMSANDVVTVGQLADANDKATAGLVKWDKDADGNVTNDIKGVSFDGNGAFSTTVSRSMFGGTNTLSFNDAGLTISGTKDDGSAYGKTTILGGTVTTNKVTGLAAGINDTDAVNKAQLDQVDTKVEGLDKLAVKYDSDGKDTITFGGADGTALKNVSDIELKVKGGSRGLVASGITPGTVYASIDGWTEGAAADTGSLAIGGGMTGSYSSAASVRGKNSVAIGSGASVDVSIAKVDSGWNAFDSANGTAVGVGASVTGVQGTAIGYGSTASANQTVAVGEQAKANAQYGTAIGQNAGVDAIRGTALGQDASVGSGADNSIALGYGSTVFSSDIKDSDKNGVLSIGRGGEERRIIHVADGINDTDAVNLKQLGDSISAATKDAVLWDDAAHTKISGVTIHDGLVNANQVIAAKAFIGGVEFDGLGNLAAQGNITAKDISAATAVLGGVTFAGNGQINGVAAGIQDTDAVNVKQLRDTVNGAVAEGTKDAVKYASNGELHAGKEPTGKLDLKNDGSASISSSNGNSVTVGQNGTTITGNTNIKGNTDITGDLNVGGKFYVNGKEIATQGDIKNLSGAIGDMDENGKVVLKNQGTSLTDGINKNADRIGLNEDGTYKEIKVTDTAGKTVTNLTDAVNANNDKIAATNQIVGDGKLNNNAKNLTAGINQNTADILQNRDAIHSLGRSVNKLGGEIDSVGAISAALAGLHPIDYDPTDSKYQLSAALGSYDGSSALALGGFYNFNKDVLLSLGVSTALKGERKTAGNLGVTFRIGSGAEKKAVPEADKDILTRIAELAQKVSALEEKNDKLEQENADQKKQIEVLQAKAF